jgi:hypothetical protein
MNAARLDLRDGFRLTAHGLHGRGNRLADAQTATHGRQSETQRVSESEEIQVHCFPPSGFPSRLPSGERAVRVVPRRKAVDVDEFVCKFRAPGRP